MIPMQTLSPRFEAARERLIVALDVTGAGEATELVDELGSHVGAFKVGLQLFTAAGPGIVRMISEKGHRVFLDLKFHDIPNTVARASVEAARLGVWMINMHAAGGSEMMRRAVSETKEVCIREGLNVPTIIAVTVLTSFEGSLLRETGIGQDMETQVVRLAKLADAAGLDGVVASAQDAAAIREVETRHLTIVTPGVRPKNATIDDQRRVTTPGEAVASGSDYVVVGRPIISAADRLHAAASIISEIGAALPNADGPLT